ncbi:MAG: heat-inducible transcriptional repressor HrcA [Oscillospiraceae bacterium]|jgi:heat-inducible transcriptional repressor|nr:heat-inducible transcriptional repressor HrcA [Oscillospiraceae bacterium]
MAAPEDAKSGRKKEILRAVIDRYVETAEPVGSKSLLSSLTASSATIRSEMAALEEDGLLEQPHTSAGRVPTAAGYRVYVNELMRRHRLSVEETEELNRALRRRVTELDRVIAYAGQIASRLTSFPAYALTRAKTELTALRFDMIEIDSRSFILVAMLTGETVRNKLFRLPSSAPEGFYVRAEAVLNASFTGIAEGAVTESLISAAERASGDRLGVFAAMAAFIIELLGDPSRGGYSVTGGARLLEYPEFRDAEKAQRLLGFMEGDGAFSSLPSPEQNVKTKITIGPENLARELADTSVVVTRCDMGDDTELLLGVVGPTRMDYPRVLSRLQYLARGLAEGARAELSEPPGVPEDEIPGRRPSGENPG